MPADIEPNKGKNLTIETDFGVYARYPIKTHVIMSGDSLEDALDKYVREYLANDDTILISEKIVAISQGRAFPVSEIKISRLAKFLTKFVHKSEHGIGIGSHATMELCIREVGRIKIIFAAAVAAVGKLFRVKGLFYRICGMKARAIDGPCEYTLPPYNTYAKMAPDKPNEVAERLAKHIGHDVVVIDANDLGVNVLGKNRKGLPDKFAQQVFGDNPLAQEDQQTPIAIVRKVN
ncbi:MAG: coenzyme F420-0:L-glutamate ligase [Oscillospiraceae bacterium]|jgi:F420-0:gamma-glutamyl ligase-like protein|nr:coenzyme F420-0:L-glutamate ligase [Oscillospiraceae bacterium]